MAEFEETPEAYNAEQDDAPTQAQTLADEALGRTSAFDYGDSEKVGPQGDEFEGGAPDLVDTMNQMVSSGHIDMGAFQGERNDDDQDDMLGADGMADEEFPRGAE